MKVDNAKVVALIAHDAALTANVLRVCNSVFTAAARRFKASPTSGVHIGSRELYRIIVAVAVAATLAANRSTTGSRPIDLWTHSVATAIASQLVAQDVAESDDFVFTVTNLRDVGKIVLTSGAARNYQRAAPNTPAAPMTEKGEGVRCLNHTDSGGRLLEEWNFPA